ncbi:hypothetical protein [Endozoicomonas ascidiicola]|nr:hypothetical protein [Endozoicomonas ascidiicola]
MQLTTLEPSEHLQTARDIRRGIESKAIEIDEIEDAIKEGRS